MSATENNLPILRQENVQLIVQSAPDAYQTNSASSLRCSDYGNSLLAEIERTGMTDELDRRCADYIEKARRTLRAMNERRAPFTKLFDQIRSEFTGLENAVDPAKKDTVPYRIQQARNAFAARRREEAERARQEEMRRQQRQQALGRYTQEAEDDYRRQFDGMVSSVINDLTSLNQSLTLENFEEVSGKIKNFNATLGNEWFQSCQSHAHKPFEVSDAEAIDIRQAILNRLSRQFKEQFANEVGEYRDTIADALPSKKRELERMASADAEEKARLKAELQAREADEARRLDEQRRQQAQAQAAAKEARQTAGEIGGLFDQAAIASPAAYQPKTAVRKRIVASSADGILAIVSLWWSREGKGLPLDDLCRIFKKQIAFCEKLANDKSSPEIISSPCVSYEEEVKAR